MRSNAKRIEAPIVNKAEQNLRLVVKADECAEVPEFDSIEPLVEAWPLPRFRVTKGKRWGYHYPLTKITVWIS